MSKLYFITGNDIQIREKVYCHILKWSQAQQIQPLQPYSLLQHAPAAEVEAANEAEVVSEGEAAREAKAAREAEVSSAAEVLSKASVTTEAEAGAGTEAVDKKEAEGAAERKAAEQQTTNEAKVELASEPESEVAETQTAASQTVASQALNFYLYDYLGQGDKATLAQLTEQYGEEIVEVIYLRAPTEEETALLQQNIYQSYDPYRDLAKCLQEIVETVFTGYRKTAYDFAAVLHAEAMQERAALQAARDAAQQSARAADQTATRAGIFSFFKHFKRRDLFKKIAVSAAILAAWVLIVCLVTIAIFQGVNNETSNKIGGYLIPVTKAPAATPTTPGTSQGPTTSQGQSSATTSPTTSTTPTTPISPPEISPQPDVVIEGTLQFTELTEGEWVDFAEPMEGYRLDIFGPVLRNGKYGYCVSYGSPDEAYFISCKDTNTEGDFCAQSTDGTKGVVLADGVLWYMDEERIDLVATSTFQCALSADGNALFCVTNEGLFCLDKQQDTAEQFLYFPTEDSVVAEEPTPTPKENTLIASPNGEYCAYLTNGRVTLFHRGSQEGKQLPTAFQSIQAVDNAGKYVFGTVTRGENHYFARAAVDGSRTDLLTEDTNAACYLSYNGNDVLYQRQQALWLCNVTGEATKLPLIFSSKWAFFTGEDNALYASAENTFMCENLKTGNIRLGETEIYQLQNNLLQDDLLWIGEDAYLYAKEEKLCRVSINGKTLETKISADLQDEIDKVLCSDANGALFYLDAGESLYYYSAENQANPQYITDLRSSIAYAADNTNNAVYYLDSNGQVSVVRMTYENDDQTKGYYNITTLHQFDFTSSRTVFEKKNNGMYLYYHSLISAFSFAELYSLTETMCTYVGNSNFP